jgi:hypothetical protein
VDLPGFALTDLGAPDGAPADAIAKQALARLARLELALSPVADDMAWGATAHFEVPCHSPAAASKG